MPHVKRRVEAVFGGKVGRIMCCYDQGHRDDKVVGRVPSVRTTGGMSVFQGCKRGRTNYILCVYFAVRSLFK